MPDKYAHAVPARDEHDRRAAVERITALVKVWDGVQRVHGRGDHDLDTSVEGAGDPDKLHVSVRLTALIEDHAPVTSAHDDFGISAPRRGVGAIWHRYRGPRLSQDPTDDAELLNRSYRVGLADIDDAINQMLGRDPEQHRPPRLAWGRLIEALADVGVVATEQELIDAPLTVRLSPQVKAQIAQTSP